MSEGANPLADLKVSEYATDTILACQPDAPLREVAELMANNRVHAVMVVNDVAPEPPVITDRDLAAAAASGHFDELYARDVSGGEAVSIAADDGLEVAAALLAERRVSHLVVRDSMRKPVGVLSVLDLARAISTAS
jgi:CBS domain-containing protein